MIKESVRFFFLLTALLTLTFCIHLAVLSTLDLPLWNLLIVRSYLVNGLLALITFIILNYLKEKKSNALGFIFMGGSGVKFAAFFILFYPQYGTDGDVDKLEFLTFFIPYAISLIVEVTKLVQILNKAD